MKIYSIINKTYFTHTHHPKYGHQTHIDCRQHHPDGKKRVPSIRIFFFGTCGKVRGTTRELCTMCARFEPLTIIASLLLTSPVIVVVNCQIKSEKSVICLFVSHFFPWLSLSVLCHLFHTFGGKMLEMRVRVCRRDLVLLNDE